MKQPHQVKGRKPTQLLSLVTIGALCVAVMGTPLAPVVAVGAADASSGPTAASSSESTTEAAASGQATTEAATSGTWGTSAWSLQDGTLQIGAGTLGTVDDAGYFGNDPTLKASIHTIVLAADVHLPADSHQLFAGLPGLTAIQGLETVSTDQATNLAGLFQGDAALTQLDLSRFVVAKTANVTDMLAGTALTQLAFGANFAAKLAVPKTSGMQWVAGENAFGDTYPGSLAGEFGQAALKLASPTTKAGPVADVEDLTDDEVAAVGDLNTLFGTSTWASVTLRSGNALTTDAYSKVITGQATSLSGVSNSIGWPTAASYSSTHARLVAQINMLYSPLFNGTVKVDAKTYTYAYSNAITSTFFMMSASDATSIIRDTQGSGLEGVPFTKLRSLLGTDSDFNGLVDKVKVYTDEASHRIAKVLTLDDWQIADIATVDQVTGSISHSVLYKNLGSTKTGIRLGSLMDMAVANASNSLEGKLDRLQITADGYDGAYITGVLGVKDQDQKTTLQPGGLILYSDPIDPTKTEVYATKQPPSIRLGPEVGLVKTTGQAPGTALVGHAGMTALDLNDTAMIYLSKPIDTLPTGGVATLQYIERLSNKMTATVRYQDADDGTVLARQDIVGDVGDKLNFVATATFIKNNAALFDGYRVVSDNTGTAGNYTFQSSTGKWIVTLKKVPIYTPDNNPNNLTLTATATESVEYLKNSEAYKPAEPVASITLYRFATENEDGSYTYSDWTASKAEANAHGAITKADPSFAALTADQIDKYLPADYLGTVTKLSVDSQAEVTGSTANQVLTATGALKDWLSTGGDLAITRTVNYTPAKIGPVVPTDVDDPFYAMTHKTLTVTVRVDDTALATADQAAVALGDAATQTINFTRPVTYIGNEAIEVGPWSTTDTIQPVTAKTLTGYTISPSATISASSLVAEVGGAVPAAQVGRSLQVAVTAFQADDNGGVDGWGEDGTITTEISYSMVMTYPQAGARTGLWIGILTALILALGAGGLVIGQRRRS